MIQSKPKLKRGDYFYTSWGYDQTNYDYLMVIEVSPTGKTAICRMVSPIYLGASGAYDAITPSTPYGEPFRLKVKELKGEIKLIGSYPYIANCPDAKRFDCFYPTKLGDTHFQTNPIFGH